MQALNLPPHPFRLKEQGDSWLIFDEVRRKWLVNTPEEWVRQHLMMFFQKEHHYPSGRFLIEGGFKQGGTTRRWDLLVCDDQGKPWMLVECKAPSIKINQMVFDQALQYNRQLKAPYICISNGLSHFIASYSEEGLDFTDEVPAYPF